MNYFVLFSVILIAASVIVLLIPSTTEGFTSVTPNTNLKPNANAKPKPSASRPAAAGQHNLSNAAGTADGGSSNQYLMDNLLAQQDKFVEAFENRNKTNGATTVSATTTKKKGVASTGAPIGDNVPIPKAGCNKKCVKIGDPMMALGGNCINPPRAGGAPGELDYSIKFCPAFQPPNDLREQDCMTCGYYKFTSKCKSDPNNPKKPCDYEDYKYVEYQSGPMPGTNDNGGKGGQGVQGGGQGGSRNSCSTCKLNVNKLTQCVLPGCFSADDGYLPFPDDGGYNFAEGCFYYNPDPSNPGKILPGMEGRSPGYYCPSITTGGSFDSGGGDGDPCYTKPDPIPDTANPNAPSYSLDYAKFVKIDKTCSNDKQTSKQNFTPGKDAPIDGDDMPPPINTKHRPMNSTVNHQHSGAINVYHHSSGQNHGKGQGKQSQYDNSSNSNTYVDPVGDTTVLGYL